MRYKSQKFRATITDGDLELPVEVVLERRPNVRFGITARRITLRLPLGSLPDEVQRQLVSLQHWVRETFVRKPGLRTQFITRQYQSGEQLFVGARRYILDISTETRDTHSARLIGDTISIQLSNKTSEQHRNKSIKTLLSRVVGADFHPEISQRVHEINRRTFNRPIKNIFLKYNHSNWGSCSAQDNINLSTRLLFAPLDVQEYVILHELAHLVELNHSDRFWSLVETFMPDYQEKENWLKTNRHRCDF